MCQNGLPSCLNPCWHKLILWNCDKQKQTNIKMKVNNIEKLIRACDFFNWNSELNFVSQNNFVFIFQN